MCYHRATGASRSRWSQQSEEMGQSSNKVRRCSTPVHALAIKLICGGHMAIRSLKKRSGDWRKQLSQFESFPTAREAETVPEKKSSTWSKNSNQRKQDPIKGCGGGGPFSSLGLIRELSWMMPWPERGLAWIFVLLGGYSGYSCKFKVIPSNDFSLWVGLGRV